MEVLAAFLFFPGLISPVHALTPEGNETPEETRLKNEKNFREWRDNIPDLEKRLFDINCRRQDIGDWEKLKIGELDTYKGVSLIGGYAK